ncbi:MAG: neutral/alkaline non-lysosomal ceramidase N-terminal domain-containing protein, partial [Planctomycetaceae bacterium]|nr:neutral/alkaline non-lysosomal ceramidase N-terminal domain-containing protein [Planctomycetaceae bacterium]
MRRLLSILVLTILCPAIAQAELKVGVAKTNITPDPLLPVSGGVGPGRPSTGKQGELTARAMVFEQGETRVAVVQLDLLGFPSVLCARVHKQVPRILAENILIGSTHTHSAPDCYGFPGLDGKTSGNLKYMDFVCNQAAAAINEAIDNLQTAHLKIATGEARGKIAYNYYAPELYDPRMSVIQAVTPGGKTIGTLVNYAVHPEVLGTGPGLVSPDLVGPLCDKLEADLGGMGMFMNGAQGGMITADNRNLDKPSDPLKAKWSDSRTWEECLRIGHLMASEAQRIVKEAEAQEDPALVCESMDVKFPVSSDLMWIIILGSPLKYP